MAFYNSPAELLPKQAYRWRVRFGNDNDSNEACSMKPYLFAKSITKPSYEIKTTEHKYLGVHKFNFPTHVEWKPITIVFYDVYVNDALSDVVAKGEFKNNTTLNIDTKPLINNNVNTSSIKKSVFSTQTFFATLLNKAGYYQPEEYDKEDDLLRFRRHVYKNNIVSSFVGEAKDYKIDNGTERFINTQEWNGLYIEELHPDGFVTETWKLVNPIITSVKFGDLSYEDDKIVNITVDLVYDWATIDSLNSANDLKQYYSDTGNYGKSRKGSEEKTTQEPNKMPQYKRADNGQFEFTNPNTDSVNSNQVSETLLTINLKTEELKSKPSNNDTKLETNGNFIFASGKAKETINEINRERQNIITNLLNK